METAVELILILAGCIPLALLAAHLQRQEEIKREKIKHIRSEIAATQVRSDLLENCEETPLGSDVSEFDTREEPVVGIASNSIEHLAVADLHYGHQASVDAFEGWFDEAESPRNVTAELHITYTDSNGRISERDISVKRYDEHLYEGLLLAHCHYREANRSFKLNQVGTTIDRTTGEVIPDIRLFLRKKYEASVESTIDKAWETLRDPIFAMFFVARADGRVTKKERETIASYLIDLTQDSRITEALVQREFKYLDPPSLHQFKMIVGRIGKDPLIDNQQFFDTCSSIVKSKKTQSGAETDAITYISKRLQISQVISD